MSCLDRIDSSNQVKERRKSSEVPLEGSNTDEDGQDRKNKMVSGCLGRQYSTNQVHKRRKTNKVQLGGSNSDEDGLVSVPMSHVSQQPRRVRVTSASSSSTEDAVSLLEEELCHEVCHDFEEAGCCNKLAAVGIGPEKKVKVPSLDFTSDPNAIACESSLNFGLLGTLEPCGDSFSLEGIIQIKDGILGFDFRDSPIDLEMFSSVDALSSDLSDPKSVTSVPNDIYGALDVEDYGVWDIIHQMVDSGETNEFLTFMNGFQCNDTKSNYCPAVSASEVLKPALNLIMEDDSHPNEFPTANIQFNTKEMGVVPCSAVSSSDKYNYASCEVYVVALEASTRGISGRESSPTVAVRVKDAKKLTSTSGELGPARSRSGTEVVQKQDGPTSTSEELGPARSRSGTEVVQKQDGPTSTSGELHPARSRSGTEEVQKQDGPVTCGFSKQQLETRKRRIVDKNLIAKQKTSPCKACVTSHDSLSVDITSKFCPQAITDYCNHEGRMKQKDGSPRDIKPTDLRLNAKRHLLAVGWKIWYGLKQGKRELRYTSPRGKCYYSLKSACHACMEQGFFK